jgi:hypothetical protein
MPTNAPFALILPPKSDKFPTSDLATSTPGPLPILEPNHELLALIVPFKIVTFQTVELHLKKPPLPLPIPEPYDELPALIVPFKIVRLQTVELLEEQPPLPIPEP